MTRVLVQRGAAGSSSNANHPPSTSATQSAAATQAVAAVSQSASTSRDEEQDKDKVFIQEPQSLGEVVEYSGSSGDKSVKIDEGTNGSSQGVNAASQSIGATDKQGSVVDDAVDHDAATRDLGGIRVSERSERDGLAGSGVVPSPIVTGCSFPPPPPVPPPKPSNSSMNSRTGLGSPNATRIGPSRRPASRSVVSVRSLPSGSRATSPRFYGEGEGYNSADEQSPCYVSSYDDAERERLFELDIRRTEGFEVKRMLEDGNCLFRAVADQVYGDPEAYDMVRQMCIDYMERERDHFSQFITEGFMSYCKRKRRDKVYGNNVEIQAFAEMYNRPIHIYSYSAEPINIFQGSYNTDTPIRLSYHQRNHYNSLVDPQRLTIGAGLGFSGLQGTSIDKDRVKAVIKAQQEQQIDNALLAEGRFYSDLELTEKEIECMVMEASRAEYLAEDKLKQHQGFRESSTSGAEPSSSGARSSPSTVESGRVRASQHDMVLSKSMQMALSMGFSYLQVIEAYSIFGDDVDSMVCYLLEMGGSGALPGGSSRQKGKAAE